MKSVLDPTRDGPRYAKLTEQVDAVGFSASSLTRTIFRGSEASMVDDVQHLVANHQYSRRHGSAQADRRA